MKRAAIYARFSSDRQNERSSRDQIALCSGWAERQGLAVVDAYTDDAVSGASTINRMGLAQLMRDAGAGLFDVVVCEALDRLSRDQADLAQLKKRLSFLDIKIMTVQDGEVGAMHIGLKGLMGEMFLADLAQKTHRGLRARVNAGQSGGGCAYGYAPVPGEPGRMRIVEAQAGIVRRIFTEYVEGSPPRAIVARLNAEGVPGPRGGRWNASALNGSSKRQNGILRNSLYVGEIVWNRQRFIKDPSTGKRVSRPNPESEWVRAPAPELRIVEQDLFDAAHGRKAETAIIHPAHQRRPRHLLSGLLKCGCCGASYTVVGAGRIGCAGFRERGDCGNNRTLRLEEVEHRVLDALQTQLADPEIVAEYVRAYREERERLAKDAQRSQHKLRRRLAEVDREMDRAWDMVTKFDNVDEKAAVARINALAAEKRQLEQQIAAAEATVNPVALHPGAARAYARKVESLRSIDTSDPHAEHLVAAVRPLIDKVTITPQESRKPVDITVYGLLATLLLASTGSPHQFRGELVAGTGFEPVTFRL